MDIADIKAKVRNNEYVYSQHADIERRLDKLAFAQIEDALLSGEILEKYPGTGRGESCLIVGFAKGQPIPVVRAGKWGQSMNLGIYLAMGWH